MGRGDGFGWLAGIALGATAMYFFDPRSGRRRRALARDKAVHTLNLTEQSLERLGQDFGNRTRGTVARTRRRLVPEGPISDPRLEARVRSALGRLTAHPGAIEVMADDGIILLRGPILNREVGQVIAGIRMVPGVRRVESHLVPVKNRAHVPALQGGEPRPPMVPDMFQDHMSPTSKALVTLAGAFLLATGARRGGSAAGFLFGGVGGLLLVRSITNAGRTPAAPVGAGPRRAVTVTKTIEILAPLQETFRYWTNFRNFPRFMQHVREVLETEEGLSRWVVDGPAGVAVSWEAEVTNLEPFKRIRWQSVPGSTISNAGEVRFEELDEMRTRLTVRMTYSPPGGVLGHAVATFFGADPKHQLDDDLLRFKSLLEEGKATAHGQEVARQDVQPDGERDILPSGG
jgi:uncharacterized membrane protein